MRVAIACSGLGHIFRGIEAWAADLARSLNSAGVDVTLFQGAAPSERFASAVPCFRRFEKGAGRLTSFFRHAGGWRYGCGSIYEVEQTSFSFGLWTRIRRDYDVLHVQDPWIARHLTRLHRMGLSRPKVIVGNGTGEPPARQGSYDFVQHLTPAQVDEWKAQRSAGQRGFLVPYYISTDRFRPMSRSAARSAWGLPEDAFVALCVGALRPQFKRLDYLIREFRTFSSAVSRPVVLVIAGSREAETDALMAWGKEQLGDKVRFLENVPRDRIHTLYPAADVFSLASLNEVFGISYLEAMASGVPMIGHDSATTRWIGGPAGFYADCSRDGSLAEAFARMADDDFRRDRAAAARPHVEARFSEASVVRQVIDMYECVTRCSNGSCNFGNHSRV